MVAEYDMGERDCFEHRRVRHPQHVTALVKTEKAIDAKKQEHETNFQITLGVILGVSLLALGYTQYVALRADDDVYNAQRSYNQCGKMIAPLVTPKVSEWGTKDNGDFIRDGKLDVLPRSAVLECVTDKLETYTDKKNLYLKSTDWFIGGALGLNFLAAAGAVFGRHADKRELGGLYRQRDGYQSLIDQFKVEAATVESEARDLRRYTAVIQACVARGKKEDAPYIYFSPAPKKNHD